VTPAIALEDVHFRYHDRTVLTGVSLSVAPGEVVGLLGPSGCGKSTLIRLLLGFELPAAGTVRVDGVVVSKPGKLVVLPEERSLSVVFQDLALWPHLTLHGNLAFGLAARGVDRAERERRIERVLTGVGLADSARRRPRELSGGEQQRLAIARALVLEPRAILLDEPLSNLDVRLKRELLDSFRALFEQQRVAALYVTHDLREAASLSDRIAVLERGRIVQQGTVENLRGSPGTEFVRALVDDLDARAPRR
jgi:iron(III) transport system ATP-binding protein